MRKVFAQKVVKGYGAANKRKETYLILSSEGPVIWTNRSFAPGLTENNDKDIS